MKVAIVGCGVEGSALAGLLVTEDAVDQLLLVSRDGRRARALAERLRGLAPSAAGSWEARAADARDRDQLATAVEDADIVVQAALAETNGVVLEACLDVGAHYLDMVDYDHGGAGDVFDERFKRADLLGVSNTGASPGLTDLLARQLSQELSSVEAITVRWADRSDADDLIPPTAASHTYSVCMPSSSAWEHGNLVDRDLFSDSEVFDWPEPIGTMRQFPTRLKAELRSLPAAVPRVRRIEAKVGVGIGRWRDLLEIWVEGVRRAYVNGDFDGRSANDWLISGFVPSDRYDEAIESGAIRMSAFGVAVTVQGELGGAPVRRTAIMWTTLDHARQELPWASAMAHLTVGSTVRELVLMMSRHELADRGLVRSVGALTEADRVLAAIEARPHFERHAYDETA